MRGLPDIPKRILWASILAAVALVLYALGVKSLLLPVLLVANILWLPMPSIFRSWFSRAVLSMVLLLSLLQVAATLQFLTLPKSGFITMAVVLAVLQVAVLWVAPRRSSRTEGWFTRNDAFGLIVVLFFLLPFAPIFGHHRSMERIAEIGSIQAIDATNHYAYIAESTESQHYTYKPGVYYPRGFHIAVGFVQNTVFKRQGSLNWRDNATLFFAQYMVFAAMLGYVLYLLCMSWLEPYIAKKRLAGAQALAACALGLPLAVFFLVAFVPEGFLNYYYVCATIIAALLFLGELSKGMKKEEDAALLVDRNHGTQWWLFGALLLMFGAISSWPLLLPPLGLTAAMFVVPSTWRSLAFWRKFWDVRVIPLALAFVLQLVPLYFQFKYSTVSGSQGLNAQGGLRAFHPLVLLAGASLLTYLLFSKRVSEQARRLLFNIFVPFAVFVGALVLLQYFALGEIRYYVIKSSMLLEMLFLVLAVVALVYAYVQSGWQGIKYGAFVAAVPLIAMLLLVSTMPNPLKDDRDLFRSASGQEKPPHFDEDVRAYTELGLKGKIDHFNSTLLHYDAAQDKYAAHSQLPYWMNMMQYTPATDLPALQCSGALYSNLAFGTFTPPEQQALVTTIRHCAALANQRGLAYYIVTDKASAPQLRHVFGDVAKVVY